ncbi:uncharacterized protein V1477_013462 [Vespula maculifrons]|uniref:Uncharacterized protein n=1 Tax=Vespula maculifrons TaxID=7453 RepID=A0ABD2BQ73_VESMC
MQSRDTRSRETTTKSGLGPNFTVTSSVELWTSPRELRKTQMQSRDTRIRETTIRSGLGPTLQLLVQLCFGLRRENLEIFADAIHASINKLLIQIYDGFFDFSLKYRVGIVGFGRRQHSRVLDRPFQLLLLLCFGLRRYTLETIADAIHASINE